MGETELTFSWAARSKGKGEIRTTYVKCIRIHITYRTPHHEGVSKRGRRNVHNFQCMVHSYPTLSLSHTRSLFVCSAKIPRVGIGGERSCRVDFPFRWEYEESEMGKGDARATPSSTPLQRFMLRLERDSAKSKSSICHLARVQQYVGAHKKKTLVWKQYNFSLRRLPQTRHDPSLC